MPDTAASSSAAIYIIRHGQTVLNRQGVLQGRSDHPLNPAGEDQARKAAALFRRRHVTFDHAFTSPLRRAVQTTAERYPYFSVRLRSGGKLYSGRGISTDIVGSSIMAYINALNKIVYEENER